MRLYTVWLSFIDYQPDPSEPERDRLVLGGILQAQRSGGQAYSLVARESLTEAELAMLDGIGREVLARPAIYLDEAFKKVLRSLVGARPHEPGGGLRTLSEEFNWSLFVTPPRAIHIQRDSSRNRSQVLRLANEELMIARMLRRDVSLTRPLPARHIIPEEWKAQVPPEWGLSFSSLGA